MFVVERCGNDELSGSWEGWSVEESRDGLVPFIFVESATFLALKSFFCGEVCVEDGGEYV